MDASAVLHITSLPGGGVDRHIRDIARASSCRHLAWHVAESAQAFETFSPTRVYPLEIDAHQRHDGALAEFFRAQGVGLVHVHALTPACRERAQWASARLGVPVVVTLHDVLFLNPAGLDTPSLSPDAAWAAQVRAFLAAAVRRIAPSRYIASLAREHLGLEIDVVPNGSPTRTPVRREPRGEFTARRPKHVVGVMGAIGPHKGARMLEAVAERLEGSDIALVVIGYLDVEVVPGWHRPALFIHGAYSDEEVGPLYHAYGVELVLFPNQAPESFSYALSDTWAARLPVLVPPVGALAERVRAHGGGWVLPDGFDAGTIAARLRELLSPGADAERTQVESAIDPADPQRIPRLDTMARSLDAFYERYGMPATGPVDPLAAPAQEVLATQLNGALFRVELVRLADEMRQARESLAHMEEKQRWIGKLEGDVAALRGELAAEVDQRRRLDEENRQLRVEKAAFDRLPALVQRVLRRMARRAGH